ncbi:MAG TPA: hypothetical protein VL282_02440, partial [Tepidisphaeraceae bacterium]|nr:hypothetical protein [Tepidisphaeraceae bacterium]
AATLTHHEKYYGLPPLVVIRTNVRTRYESREVDIRFLNIGLLLVIGFIAAMPLGRLISGPVFPSQNESAPNRRPVRTLLLVLACVAVVAVAVTVALYFFFPDVINDSDEVEVSHPWLMVWFGCFTVGSIPTMLVTFLVMSIKRIREARQARRIGFGVLPAA